MAKNAPYVSSQPHKLTAGLASSFRHWPDVTLSLTSAWRLSSSAATYFAIPQPCLDWAPSRMAWAFAAFRFSEVRNAQTWRLHARGALHSCVIHFWGGADDGTSVRPVRAISLIHPDPLRPPIHKADGCYSNRLVSSQSIASERGYLRQPTSELCLDERIALIYLMR